MTTYVVIMNYHGEVLSKHTKAKSPEKARNNVFYNTSKYLGIDVGVLFTYFKDKQYRYKVKRVKNFDLFYKKKLYLSIHKRGRLTCYRDNKNRVVEVIWN
jgi:predicted solute-binding protein